MPHTRCYTLEQAVEFIQQTESDSEFDIYILPPEAGYDSEMEAIDEDSLGANETPDVCGKLNVLTGLRDSEASDKEQTELCEGVKHAVNKKERS